MPKPTPTPNLLVKTTLRNLGLTEEYDARADADACDLYQALHESTTDWSKVGFDEVEAALDRVANNGPRIARDVNEVAFID